MPSGSGDGVDDVERYRALLEQTHDVITVVDHEGTVRWQSPSSEPVKGYPPEELVGENVLEYVHPEDRDRVVERMRTAVEESGRLDERIDVRFRRPDGEWMWLAATATSPDPQSPIDGFVVNSRDVTDRKRAEREREREAERLQRFASIVSHDLRNPLNVAQAGIEGLRDETESTHVETVADALDRMETLIEDTLTLARQGKTIGETEPVALGALARRCWRSVPTEGATLEVVGDPTVEADPERLATVLENLVGNAVEHGSTSPRSRTREDSVEHGSTSSRTESDDAVKHGGEGVTVRIGPLDRGDGRFGFYVEDDGPGVPEAERERVFETGYSSTENGTGFGLAIVEEIVEAHGWTVRLTASEVGGARFEVTGVERAGGPAGNPFG
jgi:PAS domain S-box-containing protein